MGKHTCTCAWCMGFEPWRTDYAECFCRRWRKTRVAIEAKQATEVFWIDSMPFSVAEGQ